MKSKQTAVDWLFDQMEQMQYFIGNDLYNAVKEAKEMEKEQMFNYIKKNYVIGENSMKFYEEEFEQYYNETYGKE